MADDVVVSGNSDASGEQSVSTEYSIIHLIIIICTY